VTAAPETPSTAKQPYVRKRSFLARYPRWLKLGVAGVLFLLLTGSWLLPPHKARRSPEPVVKHEAPPSVPTASAAPAALPQAKPAGSGDAAITMNDTDDHGARMAHAPDLGLTESTADGELPRVGEDGRKAWQVYARPFNTNDKRPRVAIVMIDMGLSRMASDAAMRRLPANVTMAFDVQSPVVGAWLGRARQDGHETLLSLPMEPFDYPRSDPGPNTLLTYLPNTDNVQRFTGTLKCGVGYVGVTTLSGSRFTADPAKLSPLIEAIHYRGLLVLDAHVAPHSTLRDLAKQMQVPVAVATLRVDRDPSPAMIDAALNQLEQTARLTGKAVGIAAPLPVTLDHLEKWIKQLPEHGLALAPVSAVVE
jgi:uncharacterized protein